MKSPKTYSVENENNYREILYTTNARYYPSFDSNEKPRISPNSTKYKFIKEKIDKFKVIQFTPSEPGEVNPNKLVERYAILLSSKEFGNTGVNDGMISIAMALRVYIPVNEYEIMISLATK